MSVADVNVRSNLVLTRARMIAPHSLLFILFNLLYYIPLFVVLFFNYSEGGKSDAADLDARALLRITVIFCSARLPFCSGQTDVVSLSPNNGQKPLAALRLFITGRAFGILCAIVVAIFALSKYCGSFGFIQSTHSIRRA